MSACTQCGSAVTATDGFCVQCGARIKQTSTADGRSSVSEPPARDPAGPSGFNPTVSQSISAVMPQWAQVTRNGWWLLGGALLVFIGSLLPLGQESIDGEAAGSLHHSGGAVVVFLLLALCTVMAALPLLTGVLSKRRLLGATVVVAILTLFAITDWSGLSSIQKQANHASSGIFGIPGTGGSVTVSAGSGILLYTVGVVVLCVLVVRLWLFRRRAAATAV